MYGKVFDTLFTGSMRGKGDLQLVFMYMIANATQDGICDFTPRCIADATGKPLDLILECLRELESPDLMSRTRRDEGRRIRLLDPERPWGWQIVNHDHYRQIATRDAMKEAERLRKREYRAEKNKGCPGQVPDGPGLPDSGTGDGDAFSSEGKGSGEGGQRDQPVPARKPKSSRVSVNSPLMARIGAWFGRKPDTLWTVKEAEALSAIGDPPPDVDILERWYTAKLPKDTDYRRRDVQTLLNNWLGECDRARRWKPTNTGGMM